MWSLVFCIEIINGSMMWSIVSTTSAVGLTVHGAFQLVRSLYSYRSTMLLAKCLIFQLKFESKCNVPLFLTFWLTVAGVVNLKLTSPRLYVPIQSTELLFSIPFLVSQHTAMETTKHDRRKITFFHNTASPVSIPLSLPASSSHTGGSQSTSSQGSYQQFYLLFMFAPNTYAVGRGEFKKSLINN